MTSHLWGRAAGGKGGVLPGTEISQLVLAPSVSSGSLKPGVLTEAGDRHGPHHPEAHPLTHPAPSGARVPSTCPCLSRRDTR